MSTWNTTVTNLGIALQTKQVDGATITFTKVVSGSGIVPVVKLKEQTEITDIVQTLSMGNPVIKDSQYIINVLLANTGLETEYNLSQVGFYATDPDVGEILFAIAQIETPKLIPTEADAPGYGIEFVFTFQNSNNATIEITPDFAGFVTREQVEIIIDESIIDTEDFEEDEVNTEPDVSPVVLSLINEVDTAQANNYALLNTNKAESTDVYTKEEVDALIEASSADDDGITFSVVDDILCATYDDGL